jgi:hypothetical protein
MTKIVISDLHSSDAKIFLHDLSSVQIDSILGSLFQDLWGDYPNLQLTTIQDGVNNTSSTYHSPFGFYDNKILTIDFSRLTINLVVLI